MTLPCGICHLTVAEGSQDSSSFTIILCTDSDNFGSTWDDEFSGYTPVFERRLVEHQWAPVSKHTGTFVVTCYEPCKVRSNPNGQLRTALSVTDFRTSHMNISRCFIPRSLHQLNPSFRYLNILLLLLEIRISQVFPSPGV